jgi:hypothetical protein
MLFIKTEIKSYILTQSMLVQVVEKYQPSNEYVSFPILLPETDKSEQFQFLVTDNQNIQELLDDNYYVLAELLLKIKQHRYSVRSDVAKCAATVFVTLENLVYRPDRTQIIYYDDAGYGDILDKNGSRYITSRFKYKDTLSNPVLDCLCDNATTFLSFINNDLRKTLDLVQDEIGCV